MEIYKEIIKPDYNPCSHPLFQIAANLTQLKFHLSQLELVEKQNIFKTILENNLFDLYVTNVDQLRIFYNLFDQENKKNLLLEKIVSPVRCNKLIDDTDALIQICYIFDTKQQKNIILNAIIKENFFMKIFNDEDSIRIGENVFQDEYFLKIIYHIYRGIEQDNVDFLSRTLKSILKKMSIKEISIDNINNILSILNDKKASYEMTNPALFECLKVMITKIKAAKPPKLYDLCINFLSGQKNSGLSTLPLLLQQEVQKRMKMFKS